jgi:uncharacterized repeat protein (TIGR01451 family)
MKFNVPQLVTSLALGLGLALAVLALLAGVSAQAASTIRYVAPGGTNNRNTCTNSASPCATIQYAVDVATPGDEIRVAAGTYTGVTAREGYTQVVYINKSLTLRGGFTLSNWTTSDPTNNFTTLDAQGQGFALSISGTITVMVEGLRITGGGRIYPMVHPDFGIAVATATVTLQHNTIYGNGTGVAAVYADITMSHNEIYSNSYSGVAFWDYSAATLSSNNIYSNTASGVWIGSGPATLTGNTISGNQKGGVVVAYSQDVTLIGNLIDRNQMRGEDCSFYSPPCQGGGILLNESEATLEGNLISHNEAKLDGGGIALVGFNQPTILHWSHNTVIGNRADRYGGGVANYGRIQITSTSNLIVDNTAGEDGGGLALGSSADPMSLNGDIIRNNKGQSCGGLLISGQANLTNTIIADNQTDSHGSGLCVYFGPTQLWHATIARNSGGDGSGVYFATFGTSGAITLTNTILVSQTIGITASAGGTATLDGVLWFGNGSNTGGIGTINVTNETTGNPAFAADGYHLTPASAALDKGVNTGVGDDIDGQPRPFGLAPDLGADEGQPALLVSKQANLPFALPGHPLTYTLYMTNTGFVDLHATITDTLPPEVTPTGVRTWTVVIPAFGGVWTGQVGVTVAPNFTGTLTNVVEVGSVEGARGAYTRSVGVGRVYYLPLVRRN